MSDKHQFFSLPDGDVVLQSSDEIEFRVDSIILRRVSPFFASMFQLPQPKESSCDLLFMEESGAVLDDILRSIYPPMILPTLSSIDHAVALFRALQKLDISNPALMNMVTQYMGSIDPPIRAWLLAIKTGFVEPRKIAVRRFICHDDQIFDHHHLDELSQIDAKSVLELAWLRESVVKQASHIMETFRVNGCPGHIYQPHRDVFDKLRRIAGAGSFIPTEETLQIFVRGNGCEMCLDRFQEDVSVANRQRIRTSVEDLMERAVNRDVENGTLKMNVSI
jgi:hypothetical protein